MNTEEAYSKGYDCGFNAGFIEGVQSGYAQGYDDATRTMKEEAGFQLIIPALQSEIAQLRSEMKIVIAQLQGLRSDIKELKAKK